MCPNIVQLHTVTVSNVYIYIYTHTLLPYSTCAGGRLTRMIFLGGFSISSLLANSMLIAYLRQGRLHLSTSLAVQNLNSPSALHNLGRRDCAIPALTVTPVAVGQCVTLLLALVWRFRCPFSFCTLRPVRNSREKARCRSEV
jgi:hypothetical protein